MTASRRADAIALAILTSLITLCFIDVLLGINSLYLRDIAHYYYPAKHVLREIVLGGELPYWNPWLSAGQPMAANPEHEVFYPLTWLILLPSYDLGFRLLVVSHLYIAGWTMYALLRSMRIGPPAAFFGALSFALGGICLSYLNLLPILFSVAWLPLTFLFTRRFLRHRSRRDFVLASLFFGIQVVIGEPSTVLQTGLLLGMYAIHSAGGRRRAIASAVASVGAISIAASLLAAVQVLPAVDHAADSVRARGFAFRDSSDWSMPPIRIGELLYPKLLGHNLFDGRRLYWGGALYGRRNAPFLYSIYPGLLVTVMALAGMFARVRGVRVVLAAVAVSLLLAVGAHTPLWQFLFDAGVARTLRFPEKFVLMAVVALTLFGAKTLDLLLAGDERIRRITSRVILVTTLFAAAWALLSITPLYAPTFTTLWNTPQRWIADMLRASRMGWLIAAAQGLLLFLLLRNVTRARRGIWLTLAGLFVVIDLGWLVPEVAPRVERAYFATPPALVRQLPPNRDAYRLFHQAEWHKSRPQVRAYFDYHSDLYWVYRNSLFPMMPARYGVRTAMELDIDYTLLQNTADFVDSAWALSRWRRDWADVAASMSNVWYRAGFVDPRIAFALAHGDRRILQPVTLQAQERYPRYYFADALEHIADKQDFVRKLASGRFGKRTAFIAGEPFTPARGAVGSYRETANTAIVQVQTAGRAFLVMSVTGHKYWQVSIDGAEVPVVTTNIGYQGVVVPAAGQHVVEMRYRNPLIAAGGAISLVALLALVCISHTRSPSSGPSTTLRATFSPASGGEGSQLLTLPHRDPSPRLRGEGARRADDGL